MNTFPKYLKEIRYRKARCCKNCKHFILGDFKYCRLHDNPVLVDMVCKYYNKGTIKK